jgi:hypothetical protein
LNGHCCWRVSQNVIFVFWTWPLIQFLIKTAINIQKLHNKVVSNLIAHKMV